jgi:hypothetical protein
VKRALVIGAAATLTWVAVANSLPGKQAQGADWSQPKTIGTPGMTATYPRGWHATKLAGSSVAISSFALPPGWWSREQKTIPAGGVFSQLYTFGPRLDGFPNRPRKFELPDEDRHFLSCNGFEGWNVIFVDHDVAVQAFVGLGPGARKSDVERLLEGLTISRAAPSLARS